MMQSLLKGSLTYRCSIKEISLKSEQMRVDGDPLHTGKGLEGPSVHQQSIKH